MSARSLGNDSSAASNSNPIMTQLLYEGNTTADNDAVVVVPTAHHRMMSNN